MRVCSSTALASYTSFGFGCLLFDAMLPLLTLCCRFSLDLFAKRACRRNCFLQHALSQRSASAAPTVCARRPNGRRAQRVEKAGAARLFRHAVASPGALRRGPPVGWHRTYTILRSPGTRRISHAAPSASANTASSQTSAAASGGSAPHSGRNSRSCVWAISQSCAR